MKFNLTLGIFAACLCSFASVDVALADEAVLEEVLITGSRIKRLDQDGLGKVDVLTAEDFSRVGAVSVDQLMKMSPFTAGAQAGTESNYLSAKEGYGTASVNLRGLGASRTLVLVNGRRFVPGGSGANSIVDINSIPVNIVERVETLLDGSSAVYGADAVAGVVNIITKRSYEGFKLDATYGATFENDAEFGDFSLLFGRESDTSGFVFSANYTNRKEARSKDRDFSECFFEEEEGDKFCSGSSFTAGGRGSTETMGNVQFNQNPNGDPDSFVPYSFSQHAFDFQEYFVLSAPYDRYSISANGFIDLSDSVRLYTENLYTNRNSDTEASPASFSRVFSSTYLHNPTGEALSLRRRMVDDGFGARIWTQEVSTYNGVVGLEGDLSNGWSWDTSFTYGKSSSDEQFTNAIDLVRFAETVNEADCAAPTAAYQCANWFGINNASAAALNHINATVPTVGENILTDFLAVLSGNLFDMPHGPAGFAVGFEYLKNEGQYRKLYENPVRSGGGGSGAPIDASLSSSEIYAEVTLPLAESFDLYLASRYSDYSEFDGEFTYKIGGNWMINESFTVRSTYSTAVRTPNIRELYTTEELNFTTFVDPCDQWESSSDSALKTNCAAVVGPGFEQGDLFVEVDYPGNPDLNPEKADTFTLGLSWMPPNTEGLRFTIDYYQISIDDSIRNVSPTAALEQCYFSAGLSSPVCDDIFRDQFSNEVVFLVVPLVNAAKEDMSGFDFGVNYNFEALAGAFTVNWDTTYLSKFEVQYVGAPSVTDLAGTISNGEGGNGSYTKWRSALWLTYDRQNWGVSYNLDYIGSADSQFVRIGATAPGVPAVTYSAVEGRYNFTDNFLMRVGIRNLFDKQPPYYTDPIDQNTDPFTYDLLGRKYFVTASYMF
jgi:outer membrane receptor protein involved in Fe transport